MKERASGRRLQAGLLWRLLDADTRGRAAGFLSQEARTALQRSYKDYTELPTAARIKVEDRLRREGNTRWGPGPGLAFVGGMSAVAAAALVIRSAEPRLGWVGLAAVLTPLLIAAGGPLALLLLRPYQARALFRFDANPLSAGLTAVCALGLLWVLSFIGMEGPQPGRLGAVSFFFVVLGAAFAPLLEEIFFREVLPSLFGRSPHTAGHLISALLFSAAHMPDSAGMAFLYFSAAAALSALRVETDSLLWPVIAHSAANAGALLL